MGDEKVDCVEEVSNLRLNKASDSQARKRVPNWPGMIAEWAKTGRKNDTENRPSSEVCDINERERKGRQ